MRFVYRVKKILLEKKQEELAVVENKIKELDKTYSKEHINVENLKQEVNKVSEKKAEFQKNIINKKQLADLENIYNFVSNYPKIEMIVEKIKRIPLFDNDYEIYSEIDNDEILIHEDLYARCKLCETLKELNEQIVKIKDSDIENISKKELEEENNIENKTNIFSKVIEKNKYLSFLDKTIKLKNDKKIFDRYRETINEYKYNYNSFIGSYFDDGLAIDKVECTMIINNIKYLQSVKKRGMELDKEDEEYLEDMQPLELWNEILKYYSNTSIVSSIIQNFGNKIDNYEKLYKENPNLFNLENLEKIFKENNQMIVDLKSKRKDVTSKNKEFMKKKQDEKELKTQLKTLEDKKKDIIEKTERIKKAETLKELGYKNKDDAVKKLAIEESKDYIVIPIYNDIKNISEVFNEEKQIKVEIDGKKFLTMYSNDIASGKINSIESTENMDSVLMVPINSLKKEDIDNIKAGKISLNKSVLQSKELFAILSKNRDINFENSKVEINRYLYDDINKQVQQFLGEDYVSDSDEIENYDIFKNVPNVSTKEKKIKRETVKQCIFENLKRDVSHTDTILVNGKTYFLNQDDEKDLQTRKLIEPFDENKLIQIADDIETYLIEEEEKGLKIDYFYKELLLEYLKTNKKAKANYQDEDNTIISLNGKNISIKPALPPKNEDVAKRYSRSNEDIAYKTMKLANLVNKFAHLSENEKLQKSLYQVKLDLIERVIDLSKDNDNINVKRRFDENKRVMSVFLEIPKYNMIALHMMNRSESLAIKSNQLEKSENDVLQTSAILYPGVNKELLSIMKNMSIEERMQTLLDLDSNTFCKLALRMGYNSEDILSKNDRKEFIKNMISEKKISELLKENEELEK